MKNNILLTFILCLFVLGANAQQVQLSNIPVEKLADLNYIGTSDKFHFFSSSKQKIHCFDRRDMSSRSNVEYKFDTKNEMMASQYLIGERLIVVSRSYEGEKGSFKNKMNVYEFNPSTGEKIKVVKTGEPADKSLYYVSYHDDKKKQILVTINDSIINVLDYNLEPLTFVEGSKYKGAGELADLVFDLEEIMASLNLRFNITISEPDIQMKDSTSSKNFVIRFKKKEDKDIPFFNKFYTDVVVNTNNKSSKVSNVDFAIDNDKTIIDMAFRDDKDGNLILYGKYIIKGSGHAQYGMFSARYDQMMNQVSPLKYFDLLSADLDDKVVPNVKNIGLFYTKFKSSKHTFELEDGSVLFVYQKEYNNVKDHIYILKVEPSGELMVNMIPTHVMVDKKNSFATEKFIPVLLKDKLVFIMYENPNNLDKSMNDVNIYACEAKDKSSALVYCYYDITNDEVRKKKLISENSALKPLPHLSDYELFCDPETGEYICFLPGENKKNVSRILYQIKLSY